LRALRSPAAKCAAPVAFIADGDAGMQHRAVRSERNEKDDRRAAGADGSAVLVLS
jgi:hypothetical protein